MDMFDVPCATRRFRLPLQYVANDAWPDAVNDNDAPPPADRNLINERLLQTLVRRIHATLELGPDDERYG